MLYNNEANETMIDVALNHSVVLLPMSLFFAFVLLGFTYKMSFCCIW